MSPNRNLTQLKNELSDENKRISYWTESRNDKLPNKTIAAEIFFEHYPKMSRHAGTKYLQACRQIPPIVRMTKRPAIYVNCSAGSFNIYPKPL
jgi:hypothetical protein